MARKGELDTDAASDSAVAEVEAGGTPPTPPAGFVLEAAAAAAACKLAMLL